ncbi:hypothetical protein BHECKSOX_2147 [Bathymodiolus heckerae thiotrophic gill symbiont]|uniref:hypothetical protein n=1 Tax=Bathymodiolus heckerae thiotrophic gill symbiont TaxID=1052212 RepID=UPI0010B939F3|nr:hypothetical protein [Bathymodiolus heckerae thiotrophic gill symbiont]SHN89616.1 hypothetical protein BHECKSOX_2147 [Bathymodiolus heckerae thiotrophic gill symbiont]
MSAAAVNTKVLGSRCDDVVSRVAEHQVSVQKLESVAASEIITGGDVIDSSCLNSFDVSLKGLGFSLPNVDDLLDNFLNSMCDKANSVISSNINTINQGLDTPLGSISVNSNHDGRLLMKRYPIFQSLTKNTTLQLEVGQMIFSINKTIVLLGFLTIQQANAACCGAAAVEAINSRAAELKN